MKGYRMKCITLILLYSVIWLPAQSSPRLTDAGGQEPSRRNKQPQVVIDEIFQACGPLFFQSGSENIGAKDEKCLLEISLNLQFAADYFLVVDVHRATSEHDDVSLARVD